MLSYELQNTVEIQWNEVFNNFSYFPWEIACEYEKQSTIKVEDITRRIAEVI